MRERLAQLRDELEQSRTTLLLEPERVQRVVETGLDLARQPSLIATDEPGVCNVPALTGTWSRATIGLEHPAHPDQQRPVTFDHDIARGRTDVVLAHIGHPLVHLALALLRKEVWGTETHLHRVTARYAERALDGLHAVAHGRLVITGAAGHRLHEELISAAIRIVPDGEVLRLGVEATAAAIATATDRALPRTLADQLVPRLHDTVAQLRSALTGRASDRARQLQATLARRAIEEQAHVAATLTELEQTIRREAFGDDGDQLQLITGLQLDAGDIRQVKRDVESLQHRLDRIPAEIEAERAAIARRYDSPTHRLFPAAVTLLVPEGTRL
jgi:hypothetical protein